MSAVLSRRGLVLGAFIAYLGVVAFGVFGPSPGDQIRQAGDGARKVAGEIGGAVPGGATGDRGDRVDDDWLFGGIEDEAVANVAMFVPFGALFPVLVRRWRWATVPAGVALSATIEAVQLLFLSWRSPSFADIAWNGSGALIGFSLWLAASALWRRLRPAVETPCVR